MPIYARNSPEVIPNMDFFQNAKPIQRHQYPEIQISSAIDSNSIMFRSNADDHYTSEHFTNQHKIYSNGLNRNAIDPSRLNAVTSNNLSLYSRLSGSIQNLFVGSRNQYGKPPPVVRSNYSKSENNLNELSRTRGARDRLFFFTSREKVRQRRSNNFLTSGGGSFFTYNYDEEEESSLKKFLSFNMNLLRKHKWRSKDQTNPKR